MVAGSLLIASTGSSTNNRELREDMSMLRVLSMLCVVRRSWLLQCMDFWCCCVALQGVWEKRESKSKHQHTRFTSQSFDAGSTAAKSML